MSEAISTPRIQTAEFPQFVYDPHVNDHRAIQYFADGILVAPSPDNATIKGLTVVPADPAGIIEYEAYRRAILEDIVPIESKPHTESWLQSERDAETGSAAQLMTLARRVAVSGAETVLSRIKESGNSKRNISDATMIKLAIDGRIIGGDMQDERKVAAFKQKAKSYREQDAFEQSPTTKQSRSLGRLTLRLLGR